MPAPRSSCSTAATRPAPPPASTSAPAPTGRTIRGLVVGGFTDSGILLTSDGNTIAGNYIGVDSNGTSAIPNGIGISAQPQSDGNTIGGAATLDRNVISGNSQYGVELTSDGGANASDADIVIGNYIGDR